jgi:hypothetical protein
MALLRQYYVATLVVMMLQFVQASHELKIQGREHLDVQYSMMDTVLAAVLLWLKGIALWQGRREGGRNVEPYQLTTGMVAFDLVTLLHSGFAVAISVEYQDRINSAERLYLTMNSWSVQIVRTGLTVA